MTLFRNRNALVHPVPIEQRLAWGSRVARNFAGLIALLTATLLIQGCLAQFQEAIRKQGGVVRPAEETVTLETAPGGETTAPAKKAEASAEPEKQASDRPIPPEKEAQQKVDPDPSKKLVKPKPAKDLEPPSEEDLVKEAAVKLGQSFEPVVNIKICHLASKDEWWATIYHDLGQGVEIIQFVWNRELEKLDRFLIVPKRIPRNKLKVELTNNKPGSRCEILSPPWTGSGPVDKPDSLSSEFSHR